MPAGVDTGGRIRLSGEGEAGEGGRLPGDLYVEVQIKPHPIVSREDSTLYCELPISFLSAALGSELEVPTLDGWVTLQIPAETQSGKLFRVRGKGMKPLRGGPPGDLVCRVFVETPVNLTREQRELLEQFAATLQEGKDRHAPQEESWLSKVKKFFEEMKF